MNHMNKWRKKTKLNLNKDSMKKYSKSTKPKQYTTKRHAVQSIDEWAMRLSAKRLGARLGPYQQNKQKRLCIGGSCK